MALIRYPGSKRKLISDIRRYLPTLSVYSENLFAPDMDYREPFFGSGAAGFDILESLRWESKIWLNDLDPGIAALWQSVLHRPEELCDRICGFVPTTDSFYAFKASDGASSLETLERGFQKLALHQMSVSGFGAKAGGPIGGRSQSSAYPVGCRWNSATLQSHVKRLNLLLRKFAEVRITCQDYETLLCKPYTLETFVYLDPPYVDKGPMLYKHSMDESSHRRLAAALRSLNCQWALSYDDHALVRQLYEDWTVILELEITYTNATGVNGVRPKNREVLILSPLAAAARSEHILLNRR